jgi:hypothetical protein
MSTDLKSFVRLKYQILTKDKSTWYLCETYPKIVRIKWALRCARDVEHLTNKHPKVKACNDLLQVYIDKGMPEEMHVELKVAADAAAFAAAFAATYATFAAAFAATYATYAAAINAATYATFAAAFAASIHAAQAVKWKQYIEWLIEELCEYEANNDRR